MKTQEISNHTLESADGTRIGYRRLGTGTPIVLVHGSISTGEQWLAVAEQLASSHTVYVMDRRGRGLSADADDYSLQTESDDIKAMLAVAGKGSALLGHSYGAICTLEAVRTGASVSSLVLYEPPLPVDAPTAGAALGDYAAAVEAGDGDAAMRVAAKHFLRITPEETEGLAASPLWPGMVELSPTWTRELTEIDKTDVLIEEYSQLDVPTLLLVGEVSPTHLVGASRHLQQRLANVTHKIFPGQNHFAHVMDPTSVAETINAFLAR
ncbi:alpha/beta hydrolase [Pseudarthrobacter sp. NIBRBAC000502772]|uniref:alpha/beta fold hydrolase n=1 Tax=Pseudarthrobacter sp. NIBRBAC000502772 TaxID=2590775 RepID=UPI001131FB99|nr:alpha/beta hydrolase [Pseudarthrobacter sp. NIBRBAC000502772]QDG65241.1 alpha/beta hydrolase [Pseudarthrobacter sp. NIBRBAC000502772]